MRCAACDAELTIAVFPGGVVKCPSCGKDNRTGAPVKKPPAVADASPYRVAEDRPTLEPADLACPFCGGACRPAASECPHCEVRLSKVRCPTCFALQKTGDAACARCGHALELEPVLDPLGARCPRCPGHLSALGDRGMVECTACGGVFVDHPSLARVTEARSASGPLPVKDARPFERARRAVETTDVRYLPCPMCHQSMNRVNFGRRSGVVVDVCKADGTWFDAGELTQAVEWVAAGGMEQAKAKAGEAPDERARRLAQAQALAQVQMMKESMDETRRLGRQVGVSRDLVDLALEALLWW